MAKLNGNFEMLPTVDKRDPAINETAADDDSSCDEENDVTIQNDLTKDKVNERATNTPTTSQQTQRPTTPIPAQKFTIKRNMNLKLSTRPIATKTITTTTTTTPSYAETENASLSSTITNNTTSPISPEESTATTIFPHEQYKTIKKLEIAFENIAFSVKTGFFKRENKNILKGITGEFRAGQISAIVGPSGAGKSTLLNILSAYTPYGYTGDVTINGHLRDIKAFKQNCAFITQDTSLQPNLNVKEAMRFSANLKIGIHMSHISKVERVRSILKAMGLYEHRNTRTGNLSGGQKKRLAIALELVNNPPVLILDEPTSGLDSSTSNQCISLLKKLAMEGRTVICTIHQPSALTFMMFDHLYAVAEGSCIYQGAPQNLVPFLADNDLQCPETYNPADYLMEIATNDYGEQNYKLIEKVANGRLDNYRIDQFAKVEQMAAMFKVDKMMEASGRTPVAAPVFTYPPITPNAQQHKQIKAPLTPIKEMSSKVWDSRGIVNDYGLNAKEQQQQNEQQLHLQLENGAGNSKRKKSKISIVPAKLCKRENIYATPFHIQLGILLMRTFLILWRDKFQAWMRFVVHFVTAILIGFLYYGIGNDASNALNNFRYAFYTIMFIMYCAFSSILVKFPLEFPIVSREHFNRWYSLRAYYVAITLADIPIQFICTGVFIIITYYFTGQPMELLRLSLFSLIVFMVALVGQSIGLIVGASLSLQLGCIFGPFFVMPFLLFSGFFLQEKDAPSCLRFMFHISFLKHSLDGTMIALMGLERPKLDCNEIYCHHTRPQFLFKFLDLSNADYQVSFIFLFCLFIGLRIVAFYIMSFRLRLFR